MPYLHHSSRFGSTAISLLLMDVDSYTTAVDIFLVIYWSTMYQEGVVDMGSSIRIKGRYILYIHLSHEHMCLHGLSCNHISPVVGVYSTEHVT